MQTEQDAFERVSQAQVGGFVGTNPNYLVALRRHVKCWLDAIDEEIAENLLAQNLKKLRTTEDTDCLMLTGTTIELETILVIHSKARCFTVGSTSAVILGNLSGAAARDTVEKVAPTYGIEPEDLFSMPIIVSGVRFYIGVVR